MVRIDQTYAFSGNTTHWAAKVAKDGMALEEGRWSGSCEGLFFAERVGGPAPEPGIATRLSPAGRRSPARRSPGRRSPRRQAAADDESREEREKLLWELAK